jgi:hydrogenase expression/formation protein HypC
MCLAIPGQIVDMPSDGSTGATVEVVGVRRRIDLGLLQDDLLRLGDWVLIHVGFALARIDEAEATATLDLLRRGAELERELDELRHGTVA